MEQGTEFGLVDLEDVESPGDEWEEIDVSETDADRIARKRDRKFEQFEERIKDADQFKVEQSVSTTRRWRRCTNSFRTATSMRSAVRSRRGKRG